MTHDPSDMWNNDNAFYDDGEWITWTEINSHLERLEFEARIPDIEADLVPIFQNLLSTAAEYYDLTGRHLQVYGDLGELYGAITHGIKLHRNYAQGSDGRLGDHFVEVKTITPIKAKVDPENDLAEISLDQNVTREAMHPADQFERFRELAESKGYGAEEIGARDLEVMSLHDGGVDVVGDEFEADLFFEGAVVVGEETAFAG